MVEREKENIKLIFNNPGLSGNEIYKKAKSQGFGIKKQKFYEIFRTVRKLPEPTKEEKRKTTPIRYRKPVKPTEPISKIDDLPMPKKEGSYGIVEFDVKDSDEIFYVKYDTKKSLKDQVDNLKKKYKLKIKNIIFHGFGSYSEFIDKEFRDLLASVGIDL